MKTLLIGINAKYIHPATGVHQIYANSKHPVSFREFTIKDDNEYILSVIKNEKFSLLGFSVYIWNAEKVKELLQALPVEQNVVLGGPEASYRPDDFFRHRNVKYIVKDEGEEAFNQLIEHLSGKRDIKTVSNLYYREGEGYRYTFSRKPNINAIKHDLSLIGDFNNRYAYLESSRGCCFRCSYCLASLDKTIRYFPLEKVKDEIKYLLAKETRTIKFLDRTFNVDQKRMREILRFIAANDNNRTVYQFEINGDYFEDETIALIQTLRKGLVRFEIGVQTTNEITSRSILRKQNFELIKKNIAAIKNNVTIHVDLIAGLPHEDYRGFVRSFNETYELGADEIQLGILKELKGTLISATKDEHGYVFSDKPPYRVIKNNYLSEDELAEFSAVETIVNKYHNSGYFKRTLAYLFKERKLNPYETFLKISRFLNGKNINSYQPWQVAQILYLSLKEEKDEELLYAIKQDYLTTHKIRPKIWWDSDIGKNEKAAAFRKFIDKYPKLNLDLLYRYSRIERLRNQYFLVVYKPFAQYFLDI